MSEASVTVLSDKTQLLQTAISINSSKLILVHRVFSLTEEAMGPVLSSLKRLEVRFNLKSVYFPVYMNNKDMVLTE